MVSLPGNLTQKMVDLLLSELTRLGWAKVTEGAGGKRASKTCRSFSSASITRSSKLNGPELRRSSTMSEHYYRSSHWWSTTFEAHDVGARCRRSRAGALQSGWWRWSDESVDVIEHLKRISVRQKHPDDGMYHLSEIGSFTLSPPSGRISKRKRKGREGRAGDKERRGKGELSSPAILEDGRGEGSLSKFSSTFTSRTDLNDYDDKTHSLNHAFIN